MYIGMYRVCVYCKHTSMCICIYMYVLTCVQVCMFTCIYVCKHVSRYVLIFYMFACMYTTRMCQCLACMYLYVWIRCRTKSLQP